MKQIYLSIAIIALMLVAQNHAVSQCTVSPHAQPGFYPDSQHGIHPAAATSEYSLNITIVVPSDTVIMPGFPPVGIDSLTVNGFIGFPSSFQYYYNTPSQWLIGGASGCIRAYGTPGTTDIGTHSISLLFTVVIMGFTYSDTLPDYWQFEVKDASHVSLDDMNASVNSFDFYPNPAGDRLNILASETGEASIMIFSSEGRLVYSGSRYLSAGTPELISLESLRSGIYFIRVEQSTGTITEKISVIR